MGEVAAGRAGAVVAPVEDRAVEDLPAAPDPAGVRAVPRSSRSSIATGCSRPSPSSSAGSGARPPSASCSPREPGWCPSARGCGSGASSRSAWTPWPRRTSWSSATSTSSRACRGVSPPTTPACCRCSARSSRSCSRPGASVRCSPPRPLPWASTCRPARWCWRSSSSTTARPTSTSLLPSTPSSPGVPGAVASTSRATRWCSGPGESTRWRSAVWARPAPTHCARAFARPTTWPSTSCPRWVVRWPARSSRPRSRSSRPTGPWWASPRRCAATRRGCTTTTRRCTATSATSGSTRPCAAASPTRRRTGCARDRRPVAPRPPCRWRP